MADNCFQVWHCSVNEFVLFCGQLIVSFLPFVLSYFHTHTGTLFDFPLFVFIFLLSDSHIYPLLGSLNALSFTFSLNLSPSFLSAFTFFGVAAFNIFALLVPCLCLGLLSGC